MKELKFDKERVSSFLKVSRHLLTDIRFNEGELGEDMITDQLTVQMDAYIYSLIKDERILVYYCERPKFFDWLFRRERRVEWKLITKDLLIDPPQSNTQRIYITELLK